MKEKQFSVRVPYPGGIISVNHYKYPGGRHTRPQASAWMNGLVLAVRAEQNRLGVVIWPPVHIQVSGHFKNWRSVPDLHNLHKVIGDALQQGLAIDDKLFLFEDGGITVGADDPYLTITIG